MPIINIKPAPLKKIEKDSLSLMKIRAVKSEIMTPINRASKALLFIKDLTIKNMSVKKNSNKAVWFTINLSKERPMNL